MPATATVCMAHNGNGAVGWLIPQPRVIDEKGDSVRLDDVVGGRWTVLHTGPATDFRAWRTAGVPTLKVTPPHSVPSADCIVDSDGSLTRWLEKKGATWWWCGPTGSSTPPPTRTSRCRHPRPDSSRKGRANDQ